jgi:hypothetical protein
MLNPAAYGGSARLFSSALKRILSVVIEKNPKNALDIKQVFDTLISIE